MSIVVIKPNLNIEFVNSGDADRRGAFSLVFCSMLFVSALFVADITTMKLLRYDIFGETFLFPVGTLAFSITFLATDVICELTGGRRYANRVVLFALLLRILAFLYYHGAIGDSGGKVLGLDVASSWTPNKQVHFAFILGSTARIALSGLVSAIVAFLIDTYIFTKLRKRWENKNLYWFRNGITTTASQIINSTIFISLAFGGILSVNEVAMTAVGQIIMKILFAWLDTPLALILRNYGQGRRFWYAVWKSDFYVG